MKDKKTQAPSDSDEFEIVDDENVAISEGIEPLESAPPVAPSASAVNVAELSAALQKATNDHLYLRAEYDNFRKNSIKERADLLRFGGERLAKDLLDTLDIFDTALASEVTPENYKVFVDGIKMTAQKLTEALQKHSITPVECEGKAFDPAINEALGSEPTDAVPAGHVTKVFKKPYKFHDKVLRVGQVIVAKPKDS